jgi:hypothetical protein
MPAPRRRRRDRESQNQCAGTPATVPTATGEIPDPVENLARNPTHDEIARRPRSRPRPGMKRPAEIELRLLAAGYHLAQP